MSEQHLMRVVEFFETLDRHKLRDLDRHYAADAYFKDPFNDVRGLDAITQIFNHMYQQLHEPRFVIILKMQHGDDAFLTWKFVFRMKRFSREEQCIRGATHLHFNAAGLIDNHRDYWDAAEELYEKLPVLGSLMLWLKRRAQH